MDMLAVEHKGAAALLQVGLLSAILHVAHAPFHHFGCILRAEVEAAVEQHNNDVGLAVVGHHGVVASLPVLPPPTADRHKGIGVPRDARRPFDLAFLAEVETSLEADAAGVAASRHHRPKLRVFQRVDCEDAQVDAARDHLVVFVGAQFGA